MPKTNCRDCGFATCMVFATMVAQGVKDTGDCPRIAEEKGRQLADYMGRFHLE